MFRRMGLATAAVATVSLALLHASSASAQQWAEKMFSENGHDFGAVPKAAKIEHRFKVTNLYKEDIHLSSVRSSCGCTIPRIEKDTLKTGETGEIVAEFNTRAFSGQRGAQVTVTIDKPFYAEVRLQIKGYIRTDVVLNPSYVALGSVDQGAPVVKRMNLNYAGRSDWKITDVRSASPYIKAEARETARGNGLVSYQIAVSLTPDAPAGYISDKLQLITNDRRATNVSVNVEGLVVAPLAVSPSALMLGILQPGQKVTKQIIVRGKEPFRITEIETGDDRYQFKTSDQEKALHVIPLEFTAGNTPEKISNTIRIFTDLENDKSVELKVSGQVTAPLASGKK